MAPRRIVPKRRRPRFDGFVPPWTWVASLSFHAGTIIGFGWMALHARAPGTAAAGDPAVPPASEARSTLVLPSFTQTDIDVDHEPDETGEPPVATGGSAVAHPDSVRPGRGGDAHAPTPATNLSNADEQVRLSPDLLSHTGRDQMQRLRSAAARAAYEDRRATPQPQELTFLASGPGRRPERRPPAPADPSRGVRAAAPAAVMGGTLGAPEAAELQPLGAKIGTGRPGTLLASPGTGVDDGRPGLDHRVSAAVARGRPDVTRGPVSVPASVRGRPSDTVDSEQQVADAVRSIVQASTAGGNPGPGEGGSGGGGDPSSGGLAGLGWRSQPFGDGEGEWFDFNTHDPRVRLYFRKLHARIDPLWREAFPKSAALELKQGTVILEFTVERDGSARVSWPPKRPSGIDEFDRNCAEAIRRAAPFEPIPPELGLSALRIRAPFSADNPIVR